MPQLLYEPYVNPNSLPLLHQGKVRETHATNFEEFLLIVASDRISTHNIVHESLIPNNGELLTMMTIYWLTTVLNDLPSHLVAHGRKIYGFLPKGLQELYPGLHYRALVVSRLNMVKVEFIFRRYLTGSLLKAYQRGEDPYRLNLAQGLTQMSRFNEPVFTPTDKSETDDPLVPETVIQRYDASVHLVSIATSRVEKFLEGLGISLVDTKLEIGHDFDEERTEEGTLADELFTPDSSRFVRTEDIVEGQEPPWLDKQFVRSAAEELWGDGPKTPLDFPKEVIAKTVSIYEEILQIITGKSRQDWRTVLDEIT